MTWVELGLCHCVEAPGLCDKGPRAFTGAVGGVST